MIRVRESCSPIYDARGKMTPLLFGWRELLRSKGRVALVAGILAMQASALGGGFIGFESIFHTRDVYEDKLALADLEIDFVGATAAEMPSLEELGAIPGVVAVDRRFVSLGYVESGEGDARRTYPVVVHYLDGPAHPKVDDVEVTRGAWLSAAQPDGALVDPLFFEKRGMKVGDAIVVNPSRDAMRVVVTGTALSAEYLIPTANPDTIVPDKGSMGVLYVSHEKQKSLFAEPLYDQLLFRFDPRADAARVSAEVRARIDAGKKLDVERVVPRASNFGHAYIDEVIGGSRIYMPATASLLALIATIAALVSVRRLLVSRRREIGTLVAFGYTPRQIIFGFALFGIVPGVLGALLGVPGAIAFGWNIARSNADAAGMPAPIMLYAPSFFAIAALSSIAVGVASVVFPALALTKLRPTEALRGAEEIRFVGMPRLFERGRDGAGAITGSIAVRYAFRNLWRRIPLSLATIALISLSVAMPAALLTTLSSWEGWTVSYLRTLPWDFSAGFKVPLDARQTHDAVAVRGVVDYEGWLQRHATLLRDGAPPTEMRVRGLPVPTRLSPVSLDAGRYFRANDADEAILSTSFSRGAPAPKPGDTVTLVYKGQAHRLTVAGTMSDGSLQTMFLPLGAAQRIFGQPGKVSGVNLVIGDGPPPAAPATAPTATQPKEPDVETETMEIPTTTAPPAPAAPPDDGAVDAPSVRRRLLAQELVTTVQAKADLRDSITKYLRVFHSMTIPLVGEGALLAFFFVLSILSFLLLEREPEYATLRTMGYGPWHIAAMVLVEVGVLGAIGLAASLATWAGVSLMLLEMMAKVWFRIPASLRLDDWALVAVPVAFLMVAAAIPGIRALNRLDLASVLRARGMG